MWRNGPLSKRWRAGENLILNAIPPREYDALLPEMSPSVLRRGEVLYRPGDEIDHYYFVGSGLVSCMRIMQNGDSSEVGFFGKEGVVG